MKFLEWFIKDETQKSGPSLAATPAARRCWKSAEFRNATPYNKAFYETMFKVKDFWAVPEYAELLTAAEPAHLSVRRRRRRHGEGSARRAGGRLDRDLQEVRPRQVSRPDRAEGRHAAPAFSQTQMTSQEQT